MNMTVDGFCDHTAMNADDEIHQHYTDLLRSTGTLLYGRITYQLMENYWPNVVKNPTGNPSTDEFAVVMEHIPKVVFSHSLKSVEWETARVATRSLKEEILDLKQQTAKDILIGSPSLIVDALNLELVDELQLSIHPTLAGTGLLLFNNINDRITLRLLKTKTFGCGAVLFYYEPQKNKHQ